MSCNQSEIRKISITFSLDDSIMSLGKVQCTNPNFSATPKPPTLAGKTCEPAPH